MKFILTAMIFIFSNQLFAQTSDTVSLVSGLKYIVIKEGTGMKAENRMAAEVNLPGLSYRRY